MRTHVVWLVSLGLAAVLLGCARQHDKSRAQNPRTMGFSQAGVSLVLGEEWGTSNVGSAHSLRPPTLTSEAGVIRVLLLPVDRTDPEVVADGLRQAFEENPKAAKHSFRRQQFVSKSGVRGVCISYLQMTEQNGRATEVQNSHYLVRNRATRCVAINYLAAANTDADAVNRTIRSTLALQ